MLYLYTTYVADQHIIMYNYCMEENFGKLQAICQSFLPTVTKDMASYMTKALWLTTVMHIN